MVVLIAALHWLFSGPSYGYEVSVTSPGETCDRSRVLYLSEETGQALSCASRWTGNQHDTGTDFTGDETLRILSLSTTLAADGRLDDSDTKKIDDLAAQIGKAHTGDHPFPGWGLLALKGLGVCVGVVVLDTVVTAAFGTPQRPNQT
ncbi:hypothetical protein [Kribbella speibonae]|uniref:Uncharacterized protein n=1 Tax=Kribbella speibonae TaxID=1572660 RepID=A0ABY2A5S5_9ACTN|nr:hypothetical protein [Kribbella speibonae]TCC23440.1 hypothetical protein E0H58_16795 [Kribbella speibonae]